jgi:type I restriction enzyme S subunit
VLGVATRVPDQEIVLRYRSAISEKFDNKYQRYLTTGAVSSSDPYLIAINSCKIDADIAPSDPPRILQAVLPLGDRQITLDKVTMAVIHISFEYRPVIARSGGAEVSTDLFFDDAYANLSGIIFSRAGVGELPKDLGGDFILVHNPKAENPVPPRFFKLGREYTIQRDGDRYSLTFEDWIADDSR